MELKDQIKADLATATANVRTLRDAKEAATADATAKAAAIVALQTRIGELEAMTGPWEQVDVDEIKAALAVLLAASDPATTVANVFANTQPA